jgi:hypothetical protein
MTTLVGRKVSVTIDGERITGRIVHGDDVGEWVKVRCDDGTYRLVNVQDFELDRESEIEVTT